MAEFPALNFYTDAFLGDTGHLDVTESGAYALLLFVAWRTPDGRLPDDDRILARYARCTRAQWKRVRPTVMAFFQRDETGSFFQKRLEIEREKARAKSESAKRAAIAKHLKNKDTDNADAEPAQCERPAESLREGCHTTSTSTSTSINTPHSPPQGGRVAKRFREDKTAPAVEGMPTDPWDKRVADYRADVDAQKPRPFWPMEWGYPPGNQHCRAPPSILQRYGFQRSAT